MIKALFLDRDGVINVDKNYVHKIEDFEFIEGIFEVVKYFQDRGYLIIIITNQAGIGRGYYSENDFKKLTAWMIKQFEQNNIKIDKVYYDPYHPIHGKGRYKKDSYNRKPNPGMIIEAKNKFNLSLEQSILVGDKITDVEAGINAGINDLFLISNQNKSSININSNVKLINDLKDIIRYFK